MIYPVQGPVAAKLYWEFLSVTPKRKRDYGQTGDMTSNVKFEGGCGNDAG